MEKVIFFSSTNDLSLGSYRIWVHDLNGYLNDAGIESVVYRTGVDISEFDTVICAKNDLRAANQIKREYPNKKVGIINLSADKKGQLVDFVIVGSIEEADSLSHYENVFLFPLIERMYQSPVPKQHQHKKQLTIGYHGSYTHLSKFGPHLKNALEELSQEYDFKLKIITSNTGFDWKLGKPNVDNVEIIKWNIDTVKADLLDCDIGVVPNITFLNYEDMDLEVSTDLGLYSTDYVLRLKNKSNAGRAFVFHQLGIPVVADITPSNLHILGNPDCGFAVCSKEGWKKALLKLQDAEIRQFVADNAKREFDRLYNPLGWAQKLYIDIRGINNELCRKK